MKALALILLPAAAMAQDVNPGDLPGLPEPYVFLAHSDVQDALAAMTPPMPMLCRSQVPLPDGRKGELYGDWASGLFVLAYVTPGANGNISKTSRTVLVGATDRTAPIPLTPDPTKP